MKYPKILTLGSKPITHIFDGPVEITEKLDGSQFNFGKKDGEVWMRSRNAEVINSVGANKMFDKAVETVNEIADKLQEGWSYHGEYFQAPRHNTLVYDRVPKGNIALFGIRGSDSEFFPSYTMLADIAEDLGLDVVQKVWLGAASSAVIAELIATVKPQLGGERIEGVVVKNYAHTTLIGGMYVPITVGKFVTEDFKERHQKNPEYSKKPQPREVIGEQFANEARWTKAVTRLTEMGKAEGTERDIGPCIKLLMEDLIEEDLDYIKDQLWKLYGKEIRNAAVKGFPQWYKQMLLEKCDE